MSSTVRIARYEVPIDDSIVLGTSVTFGTEYREVRTSRKKITQISEPVHLSSLFRTFTYWPPRVRTGARWTAHLASGTLLAIKLWKRAAAATDRSLHPLSLLSSPLNLQSFHHDDRAHLHHDQA